MTQDIAGELFLLLTTASGRQDSTQLRRHGLAAAALMELQLHERIDVEVGKNPRLRVLDPTPTGKGHLDQALRHLVQFSEHRA